MTDFNVQHGTSTITNTNTSVTILANTHYTAPTGDAFIRITNSLYASGGVDGDSTVELFYGCVLVTNGDNIGTSITFERDSNVGEIDVTWEIVEYIGAANGANEFIVRDNVEIAISPSNTTATSSAISGIVTDADVCPIVTGGKSDQNDLSFAKILSTTTWNGGADTFTVERGDTGGTSTISVAVVEFTGSNWTVERAAATVFTSGVATDTISSVGDISRAMCFHQARHNNFGLDEQMVEVEITNTTTVTFTTRSGASAPDEAVAWVVSNSQTDGTPMDVQRLKGSVTWSGDPDVEPIAITAVTSLATTSLGSMSGHSSGTGVSTARAMINHILTSTTNCNIICNDAGQTWTYNFEVVEWPTVAAGGSTVEGSVSITADLGISSTSIASHEASVSLASDLGVSQASVLQAQAAMQLAADVGISPTVIATLASAATFDIDAGITTATDGAVEGSVTLSASYGVTGAAQMDAQGAVTLAVEKGLGTSGGLDLSAAISLALNAGTATSSEVTIEGAISLGASLNVAASVVAAFAPQVAIGTTVGVATSVLAELEAQILAGASLGATTAGGVQLEGGIALNVEAGYTTTGSTLVVQITTPEGRVLLIQADDRVLRVMQDNRVLKIQ